MTLPIVKHSYLVLDIKDIPRIVKEAFHIAQTGRPGPVVIDIAKDVQQAFIEGDELEEALDAEMAIPGYKPSPKAGTRTPRNPRGMSRKPFGPVIYFGGGIVSGNARGRAP
jgi:acetolactate synthase-1/2/3 large subunit